MWKGRNRGLNLGHASKWWWDVACVADEIVSASKVLAKSCEAVQKMGRRRFEIAFSRAFVARISRLNLKNRTYIRKNNSARQLPKPGGMRLVFSPPSRATLFPSVNVRVVTLCMWKRSSSHRLYRPNWLLLNKIKVDVVVGLSTKC